MYALLPYGSCPQPVTNLLDVKSSPLRNKNIKLLLVYSLINNTIRKITYLFILRLNNFFRSHVLITLFFGFVSTWLLASKSLARPLSSGIEGKVSSMSREKRGRDCPTKMPAPILVVRSAHAVGKPPDKRVEREVIFSQAMTFSTSYYTR